MGTTQIDNQEFGEVEALGFRVGGLGFGFGVFRVGGLELRVWGLGLGILVWGLGLGAWYPTVSNWLLPHFEIMSCLVSGCLRDTRDNYTCIFLATINVVTSKRYVQQCPRSRSGMECAMHAEGMS